MIFFFYMCVYMDEAARSYIRALNDRNSLRKQPPHDVMNLQDKVRDVAQRLLESREAVKRAAAARYGPTQRRVVRVMPDGVYAIDGRLAVRRGSETPYVGFWNLDDDGPVYLRRAGKEWSIKYGPRNGSQVSLDEHWTSGGLRK